VDNPDSEDPREFYGIICGRAAARVLEKKRDEEIEERLGLGQHPEGKLLARARSVAVWARLLGLCEIGIDKVSADAAKTALKDINETIGNLQDLAMLLRDRIGEKGKP
jgi:hypothetical protein